MHNAPRQEKLDLYAKAYELLTAALQRYPAEMWQFKPDADSWSVHEVIVHIADSEANSFIRCRRFIAEPGKAVLAYNEEAWAQLLGYHQQSTDIALELFRWLRRASYELVKSLPEATWDNVVFHPENGMMSMDDWLDVYARHIPEHIVQMDAVYERWLQQTNG